MSNTIPLPSSRHRPPPSLDSDSPTLVEAVELSDPLPLLSETGRYRLVEELGRGGMGAVYRGIDSGLERELAVKVMLDRHFADPMQVRRFRREAWIVAQLQHPGIVPIYDFGRFAEGRPYFVMKLVEGQTLATLLKQRAERTRLLKIFEQVCQTMAFAHSRGVIHRDLKPANIMVGEFGEVQVMDWGLARVLPNSPIEFDLRADLPTPCPGQRSECHPAATCSLGGDVVGTPAYMAPEQARGDAQLDERADVYALGAILYEILTESPLHTSNQLTVVLREAFAGTASDALARLERSNADAELIRLTKDCLAPDAANRPPSAAAVAERLNFHFANVDERIHRAEVERVAALARAGEERKRRRLGLALGAAVLAVVVIATGSGLLVTNLRARRAEERAGFQQAKANRDAEVIRRVHTALDEAAVLQREAQQAAENLPLWMRAVAAARRAEHLLPADLDEPELAAHVRDTVADLEKAELAARRTTTDKRMLRQLEEVRLLKTTMKDNYYDVAGADAGYAAAFRDYGVDVTRLSPEEAARLVASSDIRLALAAALTDWAATRKRHFKDTALATRLVDVANRIDADPWNQELRALLLKRQRPAVRKLAETVDLDKVPSSMLSVLTVELSKQGDSALAIDLSRKALRRNPGDFWLNHLCAFLLLDAKPAQPEEALRYLSAAAAIRPQSPGARLNIAFGLQRNKHYREAIEHLREAIRLKPDYADAYNNIGACHLRLGEFDDAVKVLRQAVELKPTHGPAYENLARALNEKNDRPAAMAAARRALELNPNNGYAYVELALSLRKRHEWPEAERAARRGVELVPNEYYAHYLHGNILCDLTRDAEAVKCFREAIRLQPEHAESHCNLGHALRKVGCYWEAHAEMLRGHRLAAKRTDWGYPSAKWVALTAASLVGDLYARYGR